MRILLTILTCNLVLGAAMIIGILYYLVAGETVGILAATDKASVDGIVSIKYGPLAFSYDEDHKLD